MSLPKAQVRVISGMWIDVVEFQGASLELSYNGGHNSQPNSIEVAMRIRRVTFLFLSVAGLLASGWTAAGQQTRRIDDLGAEECRQDRRGMADLRPDSGRDPLQPAETDRYDATSAGSAWRGRMKSDREAATRKQRRCSGTARIYGITNWSVVFAVDARTGKERWRWDPEVNQTAVRPKICCGVVNRGLAIYQGKIIAPVIDGQLEALDAETGKPVWEARVAILRTTTRSRWRRESPRAKSSSASAAREFPVRGFFSAFDANTGQFAWRFYTVPGDPSKPFENPAMKKAAETWSGDWWKLGGGGSVWDGMAYDPDADLVYVGTGNGGPWPEELRQVERQRQPVCVFDSRREARHRRIEVVLPEQRPAIPGTIDSVQGFILADMTINGRPRKVIMQANKNGFYYVLDRVTGAFISAQPFAQVTWAKGIDQETGRPIINPEAHYDHNKELSRFCRRRRRA